MPATTTTRYIDLAERYSAHNYHPLPVVIERAQGVWVWDPEGRRYMDMLAAYSALNHGHCHPKILAALLAQAEKVTLTSRAFHNDRLGPLCERLFRITGLPKTLLMNSGTEAVETAIKIARKWAYQVKGVPDEQAEIIVCSGNFHGRTTTIVGFSTTEQYREGFGPFTPGFRVVPYGDPQALEQAIGPNTAAFLVEPIQGEAGIIIPPDGYLKRAEELCRRNNVLLVVDEIQSGLGRTGKMFAHQWENVKPDAMIVGKALGGGFYPVSAVLSSDEVMGVIHPGDHGSTFGGNPLACAVAIAALDVLEDEHLVENSNEVGTYLAERLRELPQDNVQEIRARGLWIGVHIRPSSGPARAYCEDLMAHGILAKETHEQVVRIAPPLIFTREEADWALERIAPVLAVNHG